MHAEEAAPTGVVALPANRASRGSHCSRFAVSCFPVFLIPFISASSAVCVGTIIGCSQLTPIFA